MNVSVSENVPVWTVDDLLVKDPWPEAWRAQGKPVDQLYCYEFDCTPEELWPYLADTSAFSGLMRMPTMTFEERDGRRFGKSSTAGVVNEWEELPWEWEFGRGFRFVRVYSRGPMLYNRVRYLLQELPAGRTRVYIHFGMIGRGAQGRVAVWLSERMISKRHAQAAEELRRLVREKRLPGEVVGLTELSAEAKPRLARARAELRQTDLDQEVVDRLFAWIRRGSDAEVERIRVRVLARKWDVEVGTLVDICLAATKAGVLRLSWDVICPHCRGAREALAHLGDLPERASCDPCGIEFHATGPDSIEVIFTIHESIRVVDKRLYCSAEPAAKPHILLQKQVDPGQRTTVMPALPEAPVRLRLRGEMGYQLLTVGDDGLDHVVWTSSLGPDGEVLSATGTLELHNSGESCETFVIEQHSIDQDALRPVDLFSNQSFRELFSEQALAINMQLEIGMQTIVFTDIVGSTAFYERAGDADAFAAVRNHFVEIYALVRAHGGAVVKTIGDAAMAAFGNPRDGLACALELIAAFGPEREDSPIRLRASLHHGPCIAVNLNAGIDYFGRTVNLAAKLQSLVGAHQVVCTQAVFDAAFEVSEARGLSVENLMFEPGWKQGAIPVFRFDLSDHSFG